VHQLEITVLNIIDAWCNHEVYLNISSHLAFQAAMARKVPPSHPNLQKISHTRHLVI